MLAIHPDGRLLMYRGNGAGGWLLGRGNGTGGWIANGSVIGTGWQSLGALTLVGGSPAPAPGAAAIVPLPGASTQLGCTPPGGRLRVSAKIRRVVFFVRGGARRVDHRRPFTVRLRMNLPAATRGRGFARIYFTHGRSHKVHAKTVSRTFTICG